MLYDIIKPNRDRTAAVHEMVSPIKALDLWNVQIISCSGLVWLRDSFVTDPGQVCDAAYKSLQQTLNADV